MNRIRSYYIAALLPALALSLPDGDAAAAASSASFGVTVRVAAVCGVNVICRSDGTAGDLADGEPGPGHAIAFRSTDPSVSITPLGATPDMAAGLRITAPSDRPVELDF